MDIRLALASRIKDDRGVRVDRSQALPDLIMQVTRQRLALLLLQVDQLLRQPMVFTDALL